MKKSASSHVSIVVPVFNEAESLQNFHQSLQNTLTALPDYSFEILYVNDGSKDGSHSILETIAKTHPQVSIVTLSRNFGKEYALTAGIAQSQGNAIIMLDSDGQHPVELIGKFLNAWQAGSQVVTGVRGGKTSRPTIRSRLFYAFFNKLSGAEMIAGATDFRLIDREVQTAFLSLAENGRITRGLIDWLGFEQTTLTYTQKKREFGKPTYSLGKLIQLAVHSFVSLSNTPLYVFGALGIIISTLSGILGLTVIIEQLILGDPLTWDFTGTAMLGILIVFLIGIVLMSQGILSLYISSIHRESKHRPLYVINRAKSHNLKGTPRGE